MKRTRYNIKKQIKKKINNTITKKNIVINNLNKKNNINLNSDKIYENKKSESKYNFPNIVENKKIESKNDIINIIENKIKNYDLIDNLNPKILFLISNYEREEMLKQLISEIKTINADYIIFDDVSSYKIDDPNVIINDYHRGKGDYWKTFDDMFKYCKENYYDIYVFTPNDFLNYKFDKIITYGVNLRNYEYIFNIINDGRKSCWVGIEEKILNNKIKLSFFTDCAFFTNYKTLSLLEFKMNKINLKPIPNRGSFVGEQLTRRLVNLKVPIFTPIKSFAYHGDHESLMNPEVRKIHKIISL
ncbi:MAG TPA: hypothetical protein PLN85_02005 [archaeon]|nr:hypothetical protein [archaeon]